MIKASFKRDDEGRINHFILTGHADFSEYGQDIVCSAVSAIVIGTVNNVKTLAGANSEVIMDNENGGYLKFDIKYDKTDMQNHDIAILLENLFLIYKDIVAEYSDFAGYTK